jgi:hypothetical protein
VKTQDLAAQAPGSSLPVCGFCSPQLVQNLINLGLHDQTAGTRDARADRRMGEQEKSGAGQRWSAARGVFLESLATLNVPAIGDGLRLNRHLPQR